MLAPMKCQSAPVGRCESRGRRWCECILCGRGGETSTMRGKTCGTCRDVRLTEDATPERAGLVAPGETLDDKPDPALPDDRAQASLGKHVGAIPEGKFAALWNAADSLEDAAAELRKATAGPTPRWAIVARAAALRRAGYHLKKLESGRNRASGAEIIDLMRS